MTIDYVVPMVFPGDGAWRAVLAEHCPDDPDRCVRYRSWGTEELLIRLVRKNMPWLRSIIILLAQESQVQPWMVALSSQQPGPEIRVVLHREFMPEECLPTFNSRAMEMFLKDIPGLSDCFLYGNDDMFPTSPLTEEDFFVGGLPCLRFTEKMFPDIPNEYHRACLGGLNFVAEEFGRTYSDTWLKGGHSIAPMLKSTCEHLWARGGSRIRASVSEFREVKNFNQYIYSWWQWLSGDYYPHAPQLRYVSVKKSVEDVVSAIEGGGIVCVNDNECESDYMKYGMAVQECLSKKL